jgi:hypothetical protein
MNLDYKKYLKYKSKYLKIREIMIGGVGGLDVYFAPYRIKNFDTQKLENEISLLLHFGNLYKNINLLYLLGIFERSQMPRGFTSEWVKEEVIGKFMDYNSSNPPIKKEEFTKKMTIWINVDGTKQEALTLTTFNEGGFFQKLTENFYMWEPYELSNSDSFNIKDKNEFISIHKKVISSAQTELKEKEEEKEEDNLDLVVRNLHRAEQYVVSAKRIYELMESLLSLQTEICDIMKLKGGKGTSDYDINERELFKIRREKNDAYRFYRAKEHIVEIIKNKMTVLNLIHIRDERVKHNYIRMYDNPAATIENYTFKCNFTKEQLETEEKIVDGLLKLKLFIEEIIPELIDTPEFLKAQKDLENINDKYSHENTKRIQTTETQKNFCRILSSLKEKNP